MVFNNPVELTPNEILQLTEHRPYPLPQEAWVLAQTWQRLLFAHWAVPVAMLRPLIPSAIEIDTWDGMAWVGVVPFRMTGVRLRWMPPVPGTDTFPELNVRTYVTKDGKPGVWFFSLDAGNPLAVMAARWLHLNYYNARMTIIENGDTTQYTSYRTHPGANAAVFVGNYRPTGSVQEYSPDSLDRWLTERYCLYTADKNGTIYRGDIQHKQWDLQPAEADIQQNTMAQAAGITLPDTKPLLHYAHHMDMLTWMIKPV